LAGFSYALNFQKLFSGKLLKSAFKQLPQHKDHCNRMNNIF